MNRSILYDLEIRHGAKMIEKHGLLLPKVFSTDNIETNAVKEKSVLFDMADKCKVLIKGKDAVKFISYISTTIINPVVGRIYKTLFLYNNGKILDIVKVYYLNDECVMLIIGISSFESTISFLNTLKEGYDMEIVQIKDLCHQIGVVGKIAKEVVEEGLHICLDTLKTNEFRIVEKNQEKFLIYHEQTIGNTYGIIASNFRILELYKILSKSPVVLLGGLDCYNSLRKKARSLEYGIDIDGTINPYEANLEHLIGYNHDFYGKERIMEIREEKLKRKIIGLEFPSKKMDVTRNEVLYGDIVVGYLTSASADFVANVCVGIAIIDADIALKTDEVFVRKNEELVKAKIVEI